MPNLGLSSSAAAVAKSETNHRTQPTTPLQRYRQLLLQAVTTTIMLLEVQGKTRGRWMAEEHHLFLQGLDEYGKGWKKIAALIKSRTVVQIRTHAQKYFQKLAKARQNGEDGADTTMDCRTLSAEERCSSSSVNYKKQNSGEFSLNGTTKRKSISSIVASATREQAAEHDQRQRDFIAPSQDSETVEVSYQVAPALLPFIPSTYVEQDAVTESSFQQQSQDLLSPALLEESL
jgi:SHAQKYF class myb-like DNA-binding protein